MQGNIESNKKILRKGVEKIFNSIIDEACENTIPDYGIFNLLASPVYKLLLSFVDSHVKKKSMDFVDNFIENYDKISADEMYTRFFEKTVAKYFDKTNRHYPELVEKSKDIMVKSAVGVGKLIGTEKENTSFETLVFNAFESKEEAEKYIKNGIFSLTNGIVDSVKKYPEILNLPFIRTSAIKLMENVAVCSNIKVDSLLERIYS